jgi:hypothetical protein
MARRITSGILPSGLGDLSINGNVLTVGGANSNITITPSGTGITRSSKDLQLEAQSRVRFSDADSSNWVSFRSAATVAADITWTLPATDGAVPGSAAISNQVLSTNGSGTLSWITPNIKIDDQTSSTGTFFPVFTDATTDTFKNLLNRSSTKLSYVPSSGTLSSPVVTVTASTASSTTGTGALIVTGGAGIGGQVTSATLLATGSARVNSLGVATDASGTAGEIRATNNVVAYFSSDAKFKTDVKDIPNALDKVSAIGGKLFTWTDEYVASKGGEDGYFVQKEDFGVIAQDVQAVFPEAVRTREDGSLAVDYAKLSALAFAAIVELKKEVDAIKGN